MLSHVFLQIFELCWQYLFVFSSGVYENSIVDLSIVLLLFCPWFHDVEGFVSPKLNETYSNIPGGDFGYSSKIAGHLNLNRSKPHNLLHS